MYDKNQRGIHCGDVAKLLNRSQPDGCICTEMNIAADFVQAWADKDIARCATMLAHDVSYADNVNDGAEPIAVEIVGKNAVREIMLTIEQYWERRSFEVTPVSRSAYDNHEFHCQATFSLLHRPSNQILDGSSRIVLRVANDKISTIKIFYDAAVYRAFLALIGTRF